MARKTTKTQATAETQATTAIYVRVSTAGQAEHGYSLAAQQDRLLAYCTAMGWDVAPHHIYTDGGMSGSSTAGRTAYAAMMAAAQAGDVKRIVAVKLDRLSRNVRDFLGLVDELSGLGCHLALISEQFDSGTPQGRFALTMFASLAELERHTISERMMSGKRTKAGRGGWNGSPLPYGYQWQGELSIVPSAAAPIVERIFAEFLGGATLLAVATGLDADAIPTAAGGKWDGNTVRYILGNGAYAGLAQYDGAETASQQFAAIISRDVYESAQQRLATLRRGKPKKVA
jgi:site-specific DNA recombinase